MRKACKRCGAFTTRDFCRNEDCMDEHIKELQRQLAASQGEVSFKDTRIEELESELKSLHGSFNAATKYIPKYEAVVEKLEAWCDFYTKGLHPDDAQTLYIDSLYFLEEDDDE